MSGTLFHIPLSKAQEPADGACLTDRYWSVHPEKGVAFWAQLTGYARSDEPSPQCNASEHVTRHLQSKMYPDHEVMRIPVVYVQHAAREMNRLRKEAIRARDKTRAEGRDQ